MPALTIGRLLTEWLTRRTASEEHFIQFAASRVFLQIPKRKIADVDVYEAAGAIVVVVAPLTIVVQIKAADDANPRIKESAGQTARAAEEIKGVHVFATSSPSSFPDSLRCLQSRHSDLGSEAQGVLRCA